MPTGKKAKGSTTASGSMSAAKRDKLDEQAFAFPKERKEPLNDAKHVRNAIARFDQVEGVSASERAAAWKRIKKAAKRFGIEVADDSKAAKDAKKAASKTRTTSSRHGKG